MTLTSAVPDQTTKNYTNKQDLYYVCRATNPMKRYCGGTWFEFFVRGRILKVPAGSILEEIGDAIIPATLLNVDETTDNSALVGEWRGTWNAQFWGPYDYDVVEHRERIWHSVRQDDGANPGWTLHRLYNRGLPEVFANRRLTHDDLPQVMAQHARARKNFAKDLTGESLVEFARQSPDTLLGLLGEELLIQDPDGTMTIFPRRFFPTQM